MHFTEMIGSLLNLIVICIFLFATNPAAIVDSPNFSSGLLKALKKASDRIVGLPPTNYYFFTLRRSRLDNNLYIGIGGLWLEPDYWETCSALFLLFVFTLLLAVSLRSNIREILNQFLLLNIFHVLTLLSYLSFAVRLESIMGRTEFQAYLAVIVGCTVLFSTKNPISEFMSNSKMRYQRIPYALLQSSVYSSIFILASRYRSQCSNASWGDLSLDLPQLALVTLAMLLYRQDWIVFGISLIALFAVEMVLH